MRPQRDLERLAAILSALEVWLERQREVPSAERRLPTGKQLVALSGELPSHCREVLHALREGLGLPSKAQPGAAQFNLIGNLIERAIACGGDLQTIFNQGGRLDSIPAEKKGDLIGDEKISSWGAQSRVRERGKKFSRFRRGAFQPIQTEAEQEQLERAERWLRVLVRRVPVELQRGLYFPARLPRTLGALAVEYPFPETDCPIYLIVPHGTNRQTDRQALESAIKPFREAPGGLRLVCLWDFWDNVRPPPETHGIVSMIDEWTDWERVETITRQAERSLLLLDNKKGVPDKQHHRSVRAAALLLHKYGYAPEELLLIAARSGRQITFDHKTKRRQYENNGNLSYLWSPERVSFLLNAYRHEDPEAHARELARFKAQEAADRQRAEQRATEDMRR